VGLTVERPPGLAIEARCVRRCRPCFGYGVRLGSRGIARCRCDILVLPLGLGEVTADPIADPGLGAVRRRLWFFQSGGSVLLQADEIGAERLVHGDDTVSCGTLRRHILAAQCAMDIGHDHLVKHQAVTGEHGLDGIARLECNDRIRGGESAAVLLLPGFAGSLADGVGGLAGDASDDVLEAECWLCVHVGAPGDGCVSDS